jgi:hypothetical protein
MDQVTQGNAAGAEENSAVGEELSAQSQTLNSLVVGLDVMVRGAAAERHMQTQTGKPGKTAAKLAVNAPKPTLSIRSQPAKPSAQASKLIPFDDDGASDAQTLGKF